MPITKKQEIFTFTLVHPTMGKAGEVYSVTFTFNSKEELDLWLPFLEYIEEQLKLW
jgi:hypothetical protein